MVSGGELSFRQVNADGQFLHCTDPLSPGQPLMPGDLLFEGSDAFKTHVAMYVGPMMDGNDVIESPNCGLTVRTAQSTRFPYKRHVRSCREDLRITAAGGGGSGLTISPTPVTLSVTDPDGLTIDAATVSYTEEEILREVSGELYYVLTDTDGDGLEEEAVVAPVQKVGAYVIAVTPKPEAPPSATYSLDLTVSGNATLVLAESVSVGDIPAAGYSVISDGSTANAVPGEVKGVAFLSDSQPDGALLSWDSAVTSGGTGTVHDVLRGSLDDLPVGTGLSDLCIGSSVAANRIMDDQLPVPGKGYWYLVRGRNVAGVGTYGFQSNGVEESSATCSFNNSALASHLTRR